MEIPNTLFSESKRKELCLGKNVTPKQKKAIKEWKERLDNNTFQGESHYKDYLRDLMIDALGYTRDKIKAEEGEKNTRMDYSYVPPSGKGGVLFELKDRKKKPFKSQGYDTQGQETPVEQALTYIGKNPDIDYAIVTNFEEFVLVTRFEWYTQCYHFTFPPKGTKLLDSKILEFCTIFSRESIDSKFIEKLTHETIVEEEKMSDDFYKLYHQTRLMLIQAFQEKTKIDYDNAIKIAQTYLNRLIFLFFAEDNNLIKDRVFSAGIIDLLDSGDVKDGTTKVSDYIQTMFSWMNEGSDEIDHKLGFNGEFFKEPIDRNAFFYDIKKFDDVRNKVKLSKNIKLNIEYQKSVDRYNGKISPIITNLLIMNSYNFGGESITGDYISVNILGHIFEQSIGHLEELHNKKNSQRKDDGVYYTPKYITEYICKNTIIPYLSKKDSRDPSALVKEYENDILELEKKLEQIKIIDPACGSGAFLVQAADTLISIYNEIQTVKETKGAYHVTKKGKKSVSAKNETFDKKIEMEQIRGIIQNNIYGVDINPESIEITKLSLFLKIASKNKRLIGLNQRIMHGNSLIDDKSVDENPFNWKSNFAEILDDSILDNGFDIVIGNPPYVKSRDQIISNEKKEAIEKKFNTAIGMWDLYIPFMQKGLELLKNNGKFSMIVKDTLGVSSYTTALISLIEEKYHLYQIDFFPKLQLFGKKVKVENKIVFVEKTKNTSPSKRVMHTPTMLDTQKMIELSNAKKYLVENEKFTINTKNCLQLGDICLTTYGLRLNSKKEDQKFKFKKRDLLSKIKTQQNNRLFAQGANMESYVITKDLYVEWGTERCPKKLVRPTFPELYEHEKLLMSRQKLIVAYSDQKHICDNTVIMGILAKDLKHVKNSHIKTYYSNLNITREQIENNSNQFKLKYILVILNSNLIKYFLKFNRGGIIDAFPDDWKKIPIKMTDTDTQNKFEQLATKLITSKNNINIDRSRLIQKLNQDYYVELTTSELVEIENSNYLLSLLIEKKSKKKLNRASTKYIDKYFDEHKIDLEKNKNIVGKSLELANDLVYKLYGLNNMDIKIIENSLT
jgi:hypothetical protein